MCLLHTTKGPRLIIARATLISLQEARNSLIGGWGRDRAARIMEELQQNFAKISHPPYVVNAGEKNIPAWHDEEKRAMESTNSVYFSDDIVETFFVCNRGVDCPPSHSISTVDFLSWADQSQGIVSPLSVADAIAHMTRLRVLAVTVEHRYFIAAIPEALNAATSQAEADAVLRDAHTFNSILDGVWNQYVPFEDLLAHFAANMSYLLNVGGAKEEVLVTLWNRWLGTVRFQTNSNIPPLNKMLDAFLHILIPANSDAEVISRLWRSFWTALQRGFGSELMAPEDKVAITRFATILGTARAIKNYEHDATLLFEKAKLGLESGTERAVWFDTAYIDAIVQREKKNQANG
jgi:hypothetical protein